LVTCTISCAPVIDSPAAKAGTAKRTYGVARVALPLTCSTSATNDVTDPDAVLGAC
jgi:hypothetical protein